MKELLGGKSPNQFTQTVVAAKLAAGNVRRRFIGLVLLAIGVGVQVVGNLAAL
jgi:hypothetical protein